MSIRRLAVGAGGVLALATAAALGAYLPASADSATSAGCRTNCVTTFDTVGTHDLVIPSDVTSLTVTLAGAAGAPVSPQITTQPSAGGQGGVSTITLDAAAYAGTTLQGGVGDVGQGSFLAAEGGATLLAVAGGGGGAGYAGYLTMPDQILAVYPGGNGGAPASAGVAPGGDAAAFGSLAANGQGGTSSAGAGGAGDANGANGGPSTSTNPVALAAGGAGGSLVIGSTTHAGGAGGSGYTGGGGGGIQRNVDNGDVPVDVVAPGGGGSGYLAAGLTAVAGAGNGAAASVTVTWTLAPLPASPTSTTPAAPAAPALADTGSNDLLPISVGAVLLLAGVLGLLLARRRAIR